MIIEDSRVVCCLETWIKEICEGTDIDSSDFNKLDKHTQWIVSTYYNEIKDGDYVSDEEYKEWLLKREV